MNKESLENKLGFIPISNIPPSKKNQDSKQNILPYDENNDYFVSPSIPKDQEWTSMGVGGYVIYPKNISLR